MTFDRQDWIEAAIDAYSFVDDEMSAGGTLQHAYRQGQGTPIALLDDYANMTHSAIVLYQITGNNSYLQQAVDWVAIADEHYWDNDEGGYFFTADNAQSIILRTKTAAETATPSGNSMMVSNHARLYALTTEKAYRQRAEDTVATFSFVTQSNYVSMASLLNHSELLRNMLQIIVVNNHDEEQSRLLVDAIYRTSTPARVVLNLASSTVLPEGHPASGKTLINGQPTVYVCYGTTCLPPVTELTALQSLLDEGLSLSAP